MIAIDADDMDAVRTRLSDAASDLAGAIPAMPAGAAFGPAVLGAAVAAFDTAVRGDARDLHDRWAKLETGVRAAFDDMSEFEAGAGAAFGQLQAGLG